MVNVLFLGLVVVATMYGMICTANGAPAAGSAYTVASQPSPPPPKYVDESTARSERSTNLSHITGTARKIQMFIKNRHLQLLPDGTVNGTSDDSSAYTILQRTTVGIGQLKIQGVATCQYLCMDACGLLYGSGGFSDECVFNEMIEQHHYNTYSSTKYSNDRRTFYLAINRRGQSRKVLLRVRQALGRLSSYTRVMTRNLAHDRVEELHHPMRHQHIHMCNITESMRNGRVSTATAAHREHALVMSRCRRRRKRKKKKRKCLEGESEGQLCHKRQVSNVASDQRKPHNRQFSNINNSNNSSNKMCETANDSETEDCQIFETAFNKKTKIKSKLGADNSASKSAKNNNKGHAKGGKNNNKKIKVKTSTTSTEAAPSAATISENPEDEDYTGLDSTTAWEWDDSTMTPLALIPDDGDHHQLD